MLLTISHNAVLSKRKALESHIVPWPHNTVAIKGNTVSILGILSAEQPPLFFVMLVYERFGRPGQFHFISSGDSDILAEPLVATSSTQRS